MKDDIRKQKTNEKRDKCSLPGLGQHAAGAHESPPGRQPVETGDRKAQAVRRVA